MSAPKSRFKTSSVGLTSLPYPLCSGESCPPGQLNPKADGDLGPFIPHSLCEAVGSWEQVTLLGLAPHLRSSLSWPPLLFLLVVAWPILQQFTPTTGALGPTKAGDQISRAYSWVVMRDFAKVVERGGVE